MCVPLAALAVGASIAGTTLSAYTAIQQGNATGKAAQYNAQTLRASARDAVARGEVSAQQASEQGRQIIGANRTRTLAAGIDASSGSALDILAGTAGVIQQDVATIRSNAAREAWGMRTEATNILYQGAAARRASRLGAGGTILTGGVQAATLYRGLKN